MLEQRLRNLAISDQEEREQILTEEDAHKNADLYTRHAYDEVAGESPIAVSGDELAFIKRGLKR